MRASHADERTVHRLSKRRRTDIEDVPHGGSGACTRFGRYRELAQGGHWLQLWASSPHTDTSTRSVSAINDWRPEHPSRKPVSRGTSTLLAAVSTS